MSVVSCILKMITEVILELTCININVKLNFKTLLYFFFSHSKQFLESWLIYV